MLFAIAPVLKARQIAIALILNRFTNALLLFPLGGWNIRQADELELRSVVPEVLALGQVQVRTGFFSGEPVCKAHRAAAEAAGAVAAPYAQALEMKFRGGAVAALHIPAPAQLGAGRGLSE